jgi:hypothetical protein
MKRALRTIDVSKFPDLLRIVEEVGMTGEARVLRRGHEDLAVVMPIARLAKRARRDKSAADFAAFKSAAGSWSDVDTDKLVEDIYESRRSSRPPVEL